MVIYVAIASYMDKDLRNTVYSLLSNTNNLNNIFVSIFSQDEDHYKLESMFDLFNFTNYRYEKVHYKEARGVGYARSQTQKYLDESFEYFLQVDSHSRFIKDWDIKIINDYLKSESVWGKMIFSTYPPGFDPDENGNERLSVMNKSFALKIIKSNNGFLYFEPKYYDEYIGDEYGFWAGYFCGGFAFGRSKYFLEVPYDPDILFQGEEHTMSIRFYDNDIKIICPEKYYLYHDYNGHGRKRIWESDSDWKAKNEISNNRLLEFFQANKKGKFDHQSDEKLQLWKICFIQDE